MPPLKELNEPEKPKMKVQSQPRRVVAEKVVQRFFDMQEQRDQELAFFRNRSLITYIEDSMKRVNQYKERPAWKKWWQSNLSGSTTRNKLIGILSKLAANPMEARVMVIDDTSFIAKKRERVLGALLRKAGIKNKDDEKLVLEMFEAMVKGTVVGFEGWKDDEREVKTVTKMNKKTGEITFIKENVKFWNDVHGEMVMLEDMYFGDIYQADIQDMDDCIWRSIVTKDVFDKMYKGYPDAGLVLSRGDLVSLKNDEKTVFFQPSDDLNDDEVEIFKYFNKETDEFVITANGIWINPQGKDGIQPLPFNHKKLPFWVARFELIDSKFIYGKSLPDKLIADQDSEDKLIDNILDRVLMALKAPIITQGTNTGLTEGYLEPDSVIELEEGVDGRIERLDLGEPGSASFNMLSLIQNRLEQTSISSEAIGVESAKTKTATEVSIEREGALELVSLFLKLMEFGQRAKYTLRLQNIIDFYPRKVEEEDADVKFRRIVLGDEVLANGEVGRLQVDFVDEIDQQALNESDLLRDEPVEKIQILSKFIRNFENEIIVVPRSSVSTSEALRQANEIRFQEIITQLYPDMYNREAGFQDLVSKYPEKNINRLKKEQQQQALDPLAQGAAAVPGIEGLGESQPTQPTQPTTGQAVIPQLPL